MAPTNPLRITRGNQKSTDVSECSYEPTYHLKPNNPVNFDQIQRIIREIVQQQVVECMPSYDPAIAMIFIRNVSNEVKLQIQHQNYDRIRTVVIANVTEKVHQTINWQVGTLFDSDCDGWTTFQHETSTYIINVFVACVYRD